MEKMNKSKDNFYIKWKIVAIIFIILFILETIFIIWLFNIGTDSIETENHCAYEICNLDESDRFDAYFSDDWENICYCFKNGEIEHQKYIG